MIKQIIKGIIKSTIMGLVQLILGFQTVKRFVEMGACEIGVPVRSNAHNAPEPTLVKEDWEQGVIELGRTKWGFLNTDKDQPVGDEATWENMLRKTHVQVKDYGEKIGYLDNWHKVHYANARPGMVNGTATGTQTSALNPYAGVEVNLKLQQEKENHHLNYISK